MTSDARISPTAHYTGQVWLQHGMSDARLQTRMGRLFYKALQPAMAVSHRLGGPTLEAFLLARHHLIDRQLQQAIETGSVSQVIEIASGLSPRGGRFAARYGKAITYVETDLPAMSTVKAERLKLSKTGAHRVMVLDAMRDDGPDSLLSICRQLDPDKGLAIVTEGLVNYFEQPVVLSLWRRLAIALSGFSHGLYLSDIHCKSANQSLLADVFIAGLSTFVRNRVGLLFADPSDCEKSLLDSGFQNAELLKPSDWSNDIPSCGADWADLVRVIQAECGQATPPKK